MRSVRRCASLILACCLAVWSGRTSGQETPAARPVAAPPAGSAAKDAPLRGIEEAQPPIFHLRDKHGNLQPVPGFTIEEFEDYFRKKNKLLPEDQRPRYSIQRLTVTGSATVLHADLTAQLTIQVREDNWVRVPLGFEGGLLRDAATYKGPGEQFLEFDAAGGGYVSWIRGQAGQQHELTLRMLVPLENVGDETRLELTAPRATTSELRLRVPVANAVGKVSERATLQQAVAAGNSTEFTALGLGGDFQLAWRRPSGPAPETPPALEAVGAIGVQVDSQGVTSEAHLSVRSYGTPIEGFRVRLPPGAELAPGNAQGYTVSAVAPAAATPGQTTVEVRLAKKTVGPVEVYLAAHRAGLPSKADQWAELAGFEVEGAARQWGAVAVSVVADWQILWGPSRGVRQTDQPPDALRRDDLVAAFDYSAQPFSLTARLIPKRTHIHVEPEYRVTVEPTEARLDARLKYTLRGAKVFSFDVGLGDWEFEDAGPDSTVATDGVEVADGHVLKVQLLQASAGTIEIRIRARKPIAPDARSLSLTLLQPKANSLGPASLLIYPADNVELSPNADATQGLVREAPPAAARSADRQQPPMAYRAEAGKPVFTADLRTHRRQTAADCLSRVILDEQGGRVEQTFRYQVSYEPTDALLIAVPPQLAGTDDFEVLYNGGAAIAMPLAESDPAADRPAPVPMRVALPASVIGVCELRVRYPITAPTPAAQGKARWTVPLALPQADRSGRNRLEVAPARGLLVESDDVRWVAVEPAAGTDAPALALTAEGPQAEVDLLWQREDEAATRTAVVERAWVQTLLTSDARQDRAVFRFSTSRKEIELVLPPGTAVAAMLCLLDGQRVTPAVTGENRVNFALADAPAAIHVLEVRYHFVEPRLPRGSLGLDLPRLGPNSWTRRLYWQLALPEDEYLIVAPRGFTAEHAWSWQPLGSGRRPTLTEADLEAWTGAVPRTPLPTGNCYLFSALGNAARGELRTAGRTWIVLVGAGGALLLGLLLLYVPALRRPASLLAAALAILAAAAICPEAAWLVAQAGLLGLLLTGLAVVLRRYFGRSAAAGGLAPPSFEPLSSPTRYQPAPNGNQASTKSSPASPPAAPPAPTAPPATEVSA